MYNNGYFNGFGGYPYYPTTPNINNFGNAAPDSLVQLRQQGMNNFNNANMQPNMQAQPNNSIIWVSTEKEALEYPVAPNSAVALWDSNKPVIYLKQADASGKPTTEIYELIKRQPVAPIQAPQATLDVDLSNYITFEEYNALKAKFDDLQNRFNELANEKQAAAAPAKSKKTAKGDE